MEDTISPAISDAVKLAGRDAQRLGRDVKRDLADLMSGGRDTVGQVASEAQGAVTMVVSIVMLCLLGTVSSYRLLESELAEVPPA